MPGFDDTPALWWRCKVQAGVRPLKALCLSGVKSPRQRAGRAPSSHAASLEIQGHIFHTSKCNFVQGCLAPAVGYPQMQQWLNAQPVSSASLEHQTSNYPDIGLILVKSGAEDS